MPERPVWNDSKRSLWWKIASNFNEYAVSVMTEGAEGDAGTNVATWGDSLTAGAGGTPYPTVLASLTGYSVFNGGVGGESSTSIKNRMIADPAKYGWMTIIWAGNNDFYLPDTVKSNIATMVSALGHDRYVIMSMMNADVVGRRRNEPEWSVIMQLNSDLQSIYGYHYFDVRSYLVSLYNPSIPQDVIDHQNDVTPSSLRVDHIHLNTSGYHFVADGIYNSYLTVLNGTYGIISRDPDWNDSAVELIRKTVYSTAGAI